MEYYHREAETMRARYNDVFLEKERLEQEVNSVRCCLEDERKEMAELRRQQQVSKSPRFCATWQRTMKSL